MNKVSMSLVAALAILPVSAFAGSLAASADEPVVPAAVAPVSTDSSWTGMYVGLSYGTGTFNDSFNDYPTSPVTGFVGYQRDLGRYVIGGEVEMARYALDPDGLDAATSETRVKLRAGYDMGKMLPYVTVGISAFDISAVNPDTMTLYGVGMDYRISDKFRVGAEVLRMHNPAYFDDPGNIFETNVSVVSVRAIYSF